MDDLKGAKSELHSIAGLTWYIENKLSPYEDLIVFVHCISERTDWSCEADINFTVREMRSGTQLDSVMIKQTFPTREGRAPYQVNGDFRSPFYNWRDSIVIEATVAVNKVVGVQMSPLCDFTVPQPDIADVALIIGEKRLYVSKQVLAASSPVFRSKFFSDFLEKDKKEIPIEDVDFDEFLEFLHVIYPSHANIDFLLALGDRFNSQVVVRECEAFLSGPACKLPLEKRLLYADRFGLSHLQFHFLASIKNLSEAKAMHGTKEFDEFSDKMKVALLDKILMLIP